VSAQGIYVRRWHPWDGVTREPITSERCWKCDRPKPDLAHAVMEYVAAVLAAELERRVVAAVEAHIAEHGCADLPWFAAGACGEAYEIIALLPDAMLPVAIG